uniref:Proteasome component Ecm29 N-terminal domain-containing protein n=1 Tax=Amphimedon queenslandica TaxID=400682 RepID=A0A1X7TH72_AMPQE
RGRLTSFIHPFPFPSNSYSTLPISSHKMDGAYQQDIELLEKAFLMFGLAADDREVERLIKAFLVPVTLKMNSKFKPVQDKAMELLSHITKRLQTRSQVQLPIIVLIEQLDGATPLVQNFILVYLRIGIPRLSPVDQIEILPLLIKSMNNKTKKQIDSILSLYSGALIHLTITDAAALKSLVPPDGTMKEYYLCYQLTLLLIPYSYEGDLPPPGLTVSQYKQIVSDKPVDPDTLEKMKVATIHLLSSELFAINEMLIHLIIGSCDPRHSVYELCDQKLKHNSDYEDNGVIEKLYNIYLGTAIRSSH